MKHSVRKLITLGMALSLSAACAMTALAGSWIEGERGWWYQEADGTYPAGCWKWIDGDNNGLAECYYFDPEGYMLASAVTPDGYQVDENGCWVEDGAVQTKLAIKRTEIREDQKSAGEAAKEDLYDAEGESFTKRKRAALNYLQALGYNTGGLTITKSQIQYSGMGSAGGGKSLYSLLVYNGQCALDNLSHYVYGESDADSFIEAVEDYLYH